MVKILGSFQLFQNPFKLFLAAMSSSRSDVVTKFVCPSVRNLFFSSVFLESGVWRSFKGISRKFHGRFKKVSRVFQGSFKSVSRKFLTCFKEVSRMFQECFKGVSEKFQGCFKEVLRKF